MVHQTFSVLYRSDEVGRSASALAVHYQSHMKYEIEDIAVFIRIKKWFLFTCCAVVSE